MWYNTNHGKHIANILALGGAVGGSFLVAANVGVAVVGYVLFLLSSVASLYLLRKTDNSPKSLVYQNIFFICVNIFGLYRHMVG